MTQVYDSTVPLAAVAQGSIELVSVVIPVFNEEENIARLYEAISEVMSSAPWEYEILFIDDGSRDGTPAELQTLADRDERVHIIRHRRNFGQTAAMSSGIDQARGDVIVTMDGDLQNDSRDIPMMVRKLAEGYDLVSGWRANRHDNLLWRKFPSRIANWLIARISGVPIHDTGCSLKAYRAELIRQVPLYSDLHRFIPALSALATARFAEVVVRHHPRRYGKSKYGISRVGRVLLDVLMVKMIISSAARPLHWFGGWAVPFLLISATTGAFALYRAWLGAEDTTFVLSVVALLSGYLGVHLLSTGMLGELVIGVSPAWENAPLRHDVVPGGLSAREER